MFFRHLMGLTFLSLVTTGCASLAELGVRSLVGDEAPGRGALHPGPLGLQPGIGELPPVQAGSRGSRPGLLRAHRARGVAPVSLGPVGLFLGGPDGVVSDAFETDADILAARALISGGRMAGFGPTCGNRFYLFILVGGQPEDISVLR